MSRDIRTGMKIGERVFVKRVTIVLLECTENDTNNVNDARDRVVHETTLVTDETYVEKHRVDQAIKEVLL
jgi:hypothetical protein